MADKKLKSGDLANIVEHTHKVRITRPGDKKFTGLIIEVRSDLSQQVRDVQKTITNAKMQKAKRGKVFTADELEQNYLDQMIAATVSFEWTKNDDGEQAEFNGAQPAFSVETATALYKALKFIMPQLDEAVGDEALFF